MSNNFDDLDNLEALLRTLEETSRLEDELEANRARLEFQSQVAEVREEKERLEDRRRSFAEIDKLSTSAEEADQLISSPGFKEQFCRLYHQLMTQNVETSIDVLNDGIDILLEILRETIPILKISLLLIGILRKLGDNYCNEFIENG